MFLLHFEEWIDLLAESSERITHSVKSWIKKQCLQQCFDDCQLFHPIYCGRKFNVSQRKVVDEYIFHIIDANALESSRLYHSEEEEFSSLKCKSPSSPKIYWYFA